MAFKVRKTEHRAWPVAVKLLEGDAGGNVAEIEQTFVAYFKAFSEAEHQALVDDMERLFPVPEGKERHDIKEVLMRNAAYFSRLMVGWGPEVMDDAGAAIPYSTNALAGLVTGPDGLAISAALSRAINEFRFGIAPSKNSQTSPAPGEVSSAGEAAPTSLPTT